MIDHDVKSGHLDHCQVCGSSDLRLIIDLGHQPPCDALLTRAQLNEPETSYPLRLMQCERCSLAQLDYVVPGEIVYPKSYPYRAGISWPVVAAHKEMAAALVERFGAGLVVDIGCNDGTLLAQFQALGCPVHGVEPTDIAAIAPDSVPLVHGRFTEEAARSIFKDAGKAHLITMTNVFAHMADLGEVMRGVSSLLAKDGVLVIENHYLLDILERNQFDSIYHEHIRTYTLQSLVTLFGQYGMEVFDVARVPRYGGNIRAFVARAGVRPIQGAVGDLVATEVAADLYGADVWTDFRDDVSSAAYALSMECAMIDVVGCSAPGRASTLLNYAGITSAEMTYTGELATSLKLGKYLPGSHIPVVSNQRLIDDEPEAIVLLAWHYADEIAARLRREGVKSRLIVPLPHFQEYTQ